MHIGKTALTTVFNKREVAAWQVKCLSAGGGRNHRWKNKPKRPVSGEKKGTESNEEPKER